MSEIVEYIYDVLAENADVYPLPTCIVVGLALMGLFKFMLLYLSYVQMLLELFVLPGTNVSKLIYIWFPFIFRIIANFVGVQKIWR